MPAIGLPAPTCRRPVHIARPTIPAKTFDRTGRGRNGERGPRIGKEAALLGRDVDVDEVATLDPPGTRDAMSDLFVHADAGCARKGIGQFRRRTRSGGLKELSSDPVEFRGSHAGLEGLPHRLKGIGDDTPDLFQADQIVLIRDCHIKLLRRPGHSCCDADLQTEERAQESRIMRRPG
ncbi:hypothetical protein ABIF66_005962 [Bradyrhizobium japonicum]